jgi:hypothetical protein
MFTVYRVIYTRIDAYKYSFFPRTILTWSHIPQELRLVTIDQFRAGLGSVTSVSSSSSRQECTHTWVLILRAWPNCTGKNQSYIQLKTDCYLYLGLHWESDRPKSCSELVDGRDRYVIDQQKFGCRPFLIVANPWLITLRNSRLYHPCVNSYLNRRFGFGLKRTCICM